MGMKVYFIQYRIPGAGGYIPPDPVVGGDYIADRHATAFITAENERIARASVIRAYPTAKIKSVKLLHSAELNNG